MAFWYDDTIIYHIYPLGFCGASNLMTARTLFIALIKFMIGLIVLGNSILGQFILDLF